jgi:hypothetical protein
MFRKDVFDRIGLFNEALTCAEEYDINLRCLNAGMKLGYTDAVLYNYRRHDEQKSLGKGINQSDRAIKIQAIKDQFNRMKIVVGIATFKGRELLLQKTIESLTGQCDDIVIYDNEKNPDLTDNGKFYGLTLFNEPIYYFSCDDDIIYPSDYVNKTIGEIEKHKSIITYHGRKLKGFGLNYYTGHDSYSAFKTIDKTIELDVCGTGVTAFRTDYFKPCQILSSEYKKMSDILFSLEATGQGKKIMMIEHVQGWIQEQRTNINIFTEQSKDCKVQTKLCDELWKLK